MWNYFLIVYSHTIPCIFLYLFLCLLQFCWERKSRTCCRREWTKQAGEAWQQASMFSLPLLFSLWFSILDVKVCISNTFLFGNCKYLYTFSCVSQESSFQDFSCSLPNEWFWACLQFHLGMNTYKVLAFSGCFKFTVYLGERVRKRIGAKLW